MFFATFPRGITEEQGCVRGIEKVTIYLYFTVNEYSESRYIYIFGSKTQK